MNIDDYGEEVTRVQKALLRRGYVLPRFGPDGHLGSETWQTLYNYAVDHGLYWNEDDFESESGAVPHDVIEHLLSDSHVEPTEVDSTKKDKLFFDVTGDHALLKGRKTPRNPESVHTIVLHQTAITFGATKKLIERYGSKEAARRTRFHNVACHVAALTTGEVLYVNRLPAYVWHANVANRFSVGIEVEGLYAGVEGRASTIWRGRAPTKRSEATIDAARRAVQFTLEEGLRLGMPLRWIMPHRCYAKGRRADPGEMLWKEVALWAVDNLGLRARYDVAQNGGRPIPLEWDPSALYDYAGKPLA